jgi:formate dehydrogenase subunit delta
MTSTERLVLMANQIAANRMHEDDPAAATAQHIRDFWDPRMKRMLRDNGVTGLSDIAAASLTLIDPA